MSQTPEPPNPADKDFGNPTRRTYFAEEQTLLAWWRSGLAALAVSIAVGRLVPAVTHQPRGAYVALGIGYAIVGLTFVIYGAARQRALNRELSRGRFKELPVWFVILMSSLLALLSVATVLLVVGI